MILSFTDAAWEDYQHWVRTDRATLKAVNKVIDAALRDPYSGVGKPEPLTHDLAGFWSRRITSEHRLVYEVVDESYLVVVQARGHY
ncbi:MAG: Txe/YoeB family addiction module toxin [Sporichthyaceae bacterium]